jgi:hypothetical protein
MIDAGAKKIEFDQLHLPFLQQIKLAHGAESFPPYLKDGLFGD